MAKAIKTVEDYVSCLPDIGGWEDAGNIYRNATSPDKYVRAELEGEFFSKKAVRMVYVLGKGKFDFGKGEIPCLFYCFNFITEDEMRPERRLEDVIDFIPLVNIERITILNKHETYLKDSP